MIAWQEIATAPRDGRSILVYAPPAHGLNELYSVCAWDENAGFCIDELRVPSHWQPLPAPPDKPIPSANKSSLESMLAIKLATDPEVEECQ